MEMAQSMSSGKLRWRPASITPTSTSFDPALHLPEKLYPASLHAAAACAWGVLALARTHCWQL
jgi:hypothetical protein